MADHDKFYNGEDDRYIKWRQISRKLITKLNEKILKRRKALSEYEHCEELSALTSDDESHSASSILCDEYHKRKILDAELRFKILEGFDTVSESSSLSSSLCFKELEVREDTDERTSGTENINSHNSVGDGRLDSECISYSTSFSESIEEEIESNSNVESSSTDMNTISSPILQTTEFSDENTQATHSVDNTKVNSSESKEQLKDDTVSICMENKLESEHVLPNSCKDDSLTYTKTTDVEGDDIPAISLDKILETISEEKLDVLTFDDKHAVSQPGGFSEKFKSSIKPNSGNPKQCHDVFQNYERLDLDAKECKINSAPEDSKLDWYYDPFTLNTETILQPFDKYDDETHSIVQLDHMETEKIETKQCENEILQQAQLDLPWKCDIDGSSRNYKELDGFDDLHDLFIEKVSEMTLYESVSKVLVADETDMDDHRTILTEFDDRYKHDMNHQGGKKSNDFTKGSYLQTRPKIQESNFQNVSCNKGSSSKESIITGKLTPKVSATSNYRRQSMLQSTLNRPLQFCIEKARLVTSIRESIEKARTMKERVAGRAAYEKAVKEFTEAVDKLLVEQISRDKGDHESISDITYSLDDSKLKRKARSNPIDALRTPPSKRRVTVQQELLKIIGSGESRNVMEQNPSRVENCDIPSMQRTTTYVVFPKTNLQSGRNIENTTYKNGKDILKRSTTNENTKSITLDEYDLNTDTYNVCTSKDAMTSDLTQILNAQKNSEDTAYVSDLSPADDNDKTYKKDSARTLSNTVMDIIKDSVFDTSKEGGSVDVLNDDKTFEINKTYAANTNQKINDFMIQKNVEDNHRDSSDDETLNIVDSFANIEDGSVDLDEIIPEENDLTSTSTSRASDLEREYQLEENNDDFDPVSILKYTEKDTLDEMLTVNIDGCFIQFTEGKDYEEKMLPKTGHNPHLDGLDLDNSFDDNNLKLSTKYIFCEESYDDGTKCVHVTSNPRKTNSSVPKGNVAIQVEASIRSPDNEFDQIINQTCHHVELNEKVPTITSSISKGNNLENGVMSGVVKPLQNIQFRKLKENGGGLPPMKPEASQNELSFSTSSSTSGEYSLLNHASQKHAVEKKPVSTICKNIAETESIQDEKDHKFHEVDQNFTHPPSEMIVREKSPNNVEEVCVQDYQIFQQLIDIPSACVTKRVENCNEKKNSANDSTQNITLLNPNASFESSINDLRKTAIGCLGPLREKVAFFENIERALQSNETQMQSGLDENNPLANNEKLTEIHEQDDKINLICGNESLEQIMTQKTPVNCNIKLVKSTKDSAVQVNDFEKKILQPETRDNGSLTEIDHQRSPRHDALSELKVLVEELNGKISDTNNLFANLQASFEETVQQSSVERNKIAGNLDILTQRVESVEDVLLEKLSRVEKSVLSLTQDTGAGFQMVKEEFDKLKWANTEHFTDLKRFSGELALRKEDLEGLETKISIDFEEQLGKVHTAVEKLHESKPGPSSPPQDTAKSKQDNQGNADDLRIRVIEMKNQRDAEKMYHKITRESMRALERDHDRLRQELLLAATRRHFGERRKSSRLHSLKEDALDSRMADIESPPLTSTPRNQQEAQGKDSLRSRTGTDSGIGESKHDKTTSSVQSISVEKKEKSKKQ